MERNDVQQAIVELRRRLGMTQQALAVHLGKAVVTVARWETTRPPKGESLVALIRMAQAAGHDDLAAVFTRSLGVGLPRARSAVHRTEAGAADAIRALRVELGLTQQQFAARLGLTSRAIQRYEAGRIPSSEGLAQLVKIAAEAGLPDVAKLFAAALLRELRLSSQDIQIIAAAAGGVA